MPRCHVDAFAGRYIVLCFYGSAADAHGRAALDTMQRHRSIFDGMRAVFFGVSIDPGDETRNRVQDDLPEIRFLYDFDYLVSRTCGVFPRQIPENPLSLLRHAWIIVDPTLHVLAKIPFSQENADESLFAFLEKLPPPTRYGGIEIPAPIIPNVFEPELCRHLISVFDADGGFETGVMRNEKHALDSKMKRRRDYIIKDDALIRQLQHHIIRRVNPEIERRRRPCGRIRHRIENSRLHVKGKECGNGVVIAHKDRWITQYCLMVRGSIRVKPDQPVDADTNWQSRVIRRYRIPASAFRR